MKSAFLEVAADLGRVATAAGVQVMVVGAWARGLCLGREGAGRFSDDVDFAVLVANHDAARAFFDRCVGPFDPVDPGQWRTRHRATRLPVDLVPCGGVEDPPGRLMLPAADRELNTQGLAESFSLGIPWVGTDPSVLVPPPEAFVVLKLLAFGDRRFPNDLRDIAFVVRGWMDASQADPYEDPHLLDHFASGALTYEDAGPWLIGRRIQASFGAQTRAEVQRVLAMILTDRAEPWTAIMSGRTWDNPDLDRISARRLFDILRMALEPG